jgi:hypothetical protein
MNLYSIIKCIIHPIVLLMICAFFFYSMQTGEISIGLGFFAGVSFGILAGSSMSLKLFDYIITHHPESVARTLLQWKNDGRWDALIQSINERRHRRQAQSKRAG